MKTSVCENDRSGALFCFFSKKSESVEHDPIGIRPKYNLKPKSKLINTIDSEGNN